MARCLRTQKRRPTPPLIYLDDSDDDKNRFSEGECDRQFKSLLEFAREHEPVSNDDTDSDESSDSDLTMDESLMVPEVSMECVSENSESSSENVLQANTNEIYVGLPQTTTANEIEILEEVQHENVNTGEVFLLEEIPFMPVIVKTEGAYRGPLGSPVAEQPATCLPSRHGWNGCHNFRIKIGIDVSGKRNDPAAFNEVENKLYICKDFAFRVLCYAENVPPGSIIRATAVFSLAEHAFEIVERCPVHMQADILKDDPFYEHVIRCLSEQAVYEKNAMTGRYSVIVPYEKPEGGELHSIYAYKLTCFSSCARGINRRPFMILFTLENQDIHLGRQNLDLKVCALPTRDLRSDMDKRRNMTPDLIDNNPAVSSRDENACTYSSGSQATAEPQSANCTITVEDPALYQFLLEMKHLYETSAYAKQMKEQVTNRRFK